MRTCPAREFWVNVVTNSAALLPCFMVRLHKSKVADQGYIVPVTSLSEATFCKKSIPKPLLPHRLMHDSAPRHE